MTALLSLINKNSSADELANVSCLRRQRTRTGQCLRPLNQLCNLYIRVPASRCEPEAGSQTSSELIIYAPTPIKQSYHSLFCRNNRWIIVQIVLIWLETIKS